MYIQMHLHDISEILLKVALTTINWNRKTTSMDNGWVF